MSERPACSVHADPGSPVRACAYPPRGWDRPSLGSIRSCRSIFYLGRPGLWVASSEASGRAQGVSGRARSLARGGARRRRARHPQLVWRARTTPWSRLSTPIPGTDPNSGRCSRYHVRERYCIFVPNHHLQLVALPVSRALSCCADVSFRPPAQPSAIQAHGFLQPARTLRQMGHRLQGGRSGYDQLVDVHQGACR